MSVVRSIRGAVIGARLAYPNVLHVDVRGAAGGIWRLATQDAEFTPTDPEALLGRSVDSAEIVDDTGELRLRFSDATVLAVVPARREASDDPPNWELITPEGLALEFGPGLRWRIASADARASTQR